MIIRDLRVLGRIRVSAVFMGFRGFPVRFRRRFVVFGCFVMVVFWHCGSRKLRSIPLAMPPAVSGFLDPGLLQHGAGGVVAEAGSLFGGHVFQSAAEYFDAQGVVVADLFEGMQ
jgi:hypothetical protein